MPLPSLLDPDKNLSTVLKQNLNKSDTCIIDLNVI